MNLISKTMLFILLACAMTSYAQLDAIKFAPKEVIDGLKKYTPKANPSDTVNAVKDWYDSLKNEYARLANDKLKEIYDEQSKALADVYSDANNRELDDEQRSQAISRVQLIESRANLRKHTELRELRDKERAFRYKSREYDHGNYFFPVRCAADAEVYFNGWLTEEHSNFLSIAQLSYSANGKASLYNEIYGDYIGAFRFSSALLVASNADSGEPAEAKENAIQRLIGGGGNSIFSLCYPWLGYNPYPVSVKSLLIAKLSFDLPGLQIPNRSFGLITDLGAEAMVCYASHWDKVTFFLRYKYGWIFGNDVFYANLQKDDGSGFSLHHISLGCGAGRNLKLAVNFYTGNKFVLDSFPTSISLIILQH